MPNGLAFLALALWPVVTLVLFNRLPVSKAVIWSLMLPYLFLPEPPAVFDFPAMPPLSKHTIPSLVAFGLCVFMYHDRLLFFPQSVLARGLMIFFVVTPMATVLTNSEPVFFGQVGLPGLRLVEGVALVIQQFMVLMPFLMAYSFLRAEADQRELLKVYVILGLAYSLLMLIEVRMSPQLNLWVYGYYQHIFDQLVRFGGYRPIVFLYHGIWVALFMLMTLSAAAAMVKAAEGKEKWRWGGVTVYLGMILVISKSLASLLYASVLLPLILFAGRLWQFRVAALLAFLAVSYPIMKGLDWVPEKYLLEQAATIDEERSRSLEFRFDNERVLLERAYLKPVFGWGSWGRNHILDPVTGRILTVTDGRWIITIGVYGWVGYLAEFLLISLPLFGLLSRSFVLSKEDKTSPYIGALALILGFNLFDLLPNATLTPLTWMLSGAMLGYVENYMPRKRRAKMVIETVM